MPAPSLPDGTHHCLRTFHQILANSSAEQRTYCCLERPRQSWVGILSGEAMMGGGNWS